MRFTWKILLPLGFAVAHAAVASDRYVPEGGDLQGAINASQPGDSVTIAAGARFVGHYFLPPNPGPQTITIQSSAMGSLPGPGGRASRTQAAAMPKLITPDNAPALQMTTGAAYYKIQGIEFAVGSGVYVNDLVQVGNGSEQAVSLLPHHIDFDRDYIHGDAGAGGKRGVAVNGVNITVENCDITDFKSTWQDTQAIAGWNGPGPFRILNNRLEGGTETVAFGGAVPAINGNLPSDILIQGNTFSKPLSWRPGDPSYAGMAVWAKNHIELKFAQRVTIDSNTFENNWVGADQRGFIMVFNVRAEGGAVSWAAVRDVKVTNNIIRHSAAGIVFVGSDSGQGSAGQFVIQNNLWEDISGNWGGDGRLFQIQAGVNGITFDHNTAFQTGFLMVFDSGPSYNINFTNNVTNLGAGVAGNGAGSGLTALLAYALGSGSYRRNIAIGGSGAGYPADNFWVGTLDAIGFLDPAHENFLLSSTSPFKNSATDGKDLGSSVVVNTSGSPVSAPSVPVTTPVATPVSTPAPTAPTTTIPTGWVQLVNVNSGSCADIYAVNGSQLLAGAFLQQYQCWGGTNQQFQFTPVSGGYTITSRASNMQLDVLYMSTADGATIIQYPYWGGANEIWTLADAGNGAYTVHSNNTGKCLDVVYWSTANGARIIQYSCIGGANQQFKLVPAQ